MTYLFLNDCIDSYIHMYIFIRTRDLYCVPKLLLSFLDIDIGIPNIDNRNLL